MGTRYPSPFVPAESDEVKVVVKPAAKKEKTDDGRRGERKQKRTWKENKEFEELDARMPELEEKITGIEEEIKPMTS